MRKACPGAITNTNPHRVTQELNPDICVEKLASNRMSPDMLLFLAAQESENSHSFLTFDDTQREHYTCTLVCKELIIRVLNFLTISKLTYYKNRRHCCSYCISLTVCGERCDWARTRDTPVTSAFT